MYKEGKIILDEKNMENLKILDYKVQPISKLIEIQQTSIRMSRIIKKYFPKTKDFDIFFNKKINNADKSIKTIKKDELVKIMKNFFANVDENFEKKEYEKFFSIFNYNKDDYADINEISKTIYELN